MTLANATRDAAAPGVMMMKTRGIGRSGRCGRPGAGARRGNDAVVRAGKRPAPGDRLYNFSAGPATLPLDVLEEVQGDLVNYKGAEYERAFVDVAPAEGLHGDRGQG